MYFVFCTVRGGVGGIGIGSSWEFFFRGGVWLMFYKGVLGGWVRMGVCVFSVSLGCFLCVDSDGRGYVFVSLSDIRFFFCSLSLWRFR